MFLQVSENEIPQLYPTFPANEAKFPRLYCVKFNYLLDRKNGANYENYENYEIRGYFNKYVTAGLLQESARNSNSS